MFASKSRVERGKPQRSGERDGASDACVECVDDGVETHELERFDKI